MLSTMQRHAPTELPCGLSGETETILVRISVRMFDTRTNISSSAAPPFGSFADFSEFPVYWGNDPQTHAMLAGFSWALVRLSSGKLRFPLLMIRGSFRHWNSGRNIFVAAAICMHDRTSV